MRGRQPVDAEIFGLKVKSQPLPFAQSQVILPDVANVVALAMREVGSAFLERGLKLEDDVSKLMPIFVPLTEHLMGGRLERLAPKILASTTAIMKNLQGELQTYELGKESDRNEVFDEYPECYLPTVFFAGRVTFGRFFPESVRQALASARRRVAASTPSVSNPST